MLFRRRLRQITRLFKLIRSRLLKERQYASEAHNKIDGRVEFLDALFAVSVKWLSSLPTLSNREIYIKCKEIWMNDEFFFKFYFPISALSDTKFKVSNHYMVNPRRLFILNMYLYSEYNFVIKPENFDESSFVNHGDFYANIDG